MPFSKNEKRIIGDISTGVDHWPVTLYRDNVDTLVHDVILDKDSKLYNITDALYNLGIVYFLGFSFGLILYFNSFPSTSKILFSVNGLIQIIAAYVSICGSFNFQKKNVKIFP